MTKVVMRLCSYRSSGARVLPPRRLRARPPKHLCGGGSWFWPRRGAQGLVKPGYAVGQEIAGGVELEPGDRGFLALVGEIDRRLQDLLPAPVRAERHPHCRGQRQLLVAAALEHS